MNDEAKPVLSYPTPKAEPPVPLWKHFVFVPLMFWTAVVGIGTALFFLWGGWLLLYHHLTR